MAYAPPKVAKQCMAVRSCSDVFQTSMPSLAKIKKRFGDQFSEKYVAAWIINLIDFFQVGKKMGDAQVYETSMLILQEYYMLTLADINLVFTRAKKGYYGEMYDRLDGAVILSWFRKYFEERCQEAASIYQREHESKVKADDENRMSNGRDEMAKAFKRYKKEVIQNTKKQ